MKVMRYILGLVLILSVGQNSLFSAADGLFEIEDVVHGLCTSSSSSSPGSSIEDSDSCSDDEQKSDMGYVYFMANKQWLISVIGHDGQRERFISPPAAAEHGVQIKTALFESFSTSPKNNHKFMERYKTVLETQAHFISFILIDPRKIYQKAVEIGLTPQRACFFKVPIERLRGKLRFKPSCIEGTFLMGTNSDAYREKLEHAFFNYYEKFGCVSEVLHAMFDTYFKERFLQFHELEEPSLPLTIHLMAGKEFNRTPNYLYGLDTILVEEPVNITDLEAIDWSK
ncbi:hypothetical protein K2W90_02240 [Candidatus Babeliales bacterium]|nr:hypothetical protein [Candidatus Babeliales bacterium]